MRTTNNKEGGKITEASALVYLLLATALFMDFGRGYKVNISVLFQLLNIKQLLDVVFKIFRIIKVEVGVISRSRRMRLITLTRTLIILDITKNTASMSNNNKKQWKCCVCFPDGKQHKECELVMITLRNHVPRCYTT